MTSGPAASLREALRYWARLGWVNSGGPAGQIATMHRDLAEGRRWIWEERFLHALKGPFGGANRFALLLGAAAFAALRLLSGRDLWIIGAGAAAGPLRALV